MKNLCIFLILSVFLSQFAMAFSLKKKNKTKTDQANIEHSWEPVSGNIFIDSASVVKRKNTSVALFRANKANDFGYEIKKYKAYCKKGVLELQNVEIYDNENNLLKEEKIKGKIGCEYNGVVNGSVYYSALCKM